MAGLAKMESMTTLAPALRDTVGRTAALLSTSANIALVITEPLATRETTAMFVSVLEDMVVTTASFCSQNHLQGQSLLTSLRNILKARVPSFLGLLCVLELFWS